MLYSKILQTILGTLEKKGEGRAVVVAPYMREIVAAVKKVFDNGFLSEVLFIGDPERIPCKKTFYTLVPKTDPVEMAQYAADEGKKSGTTIIKGNISSSVLLKAVLKGSGGKRVASHLYIINSMAFPKRAILVTDAGVNIAPDLNTKVQILENAVFVARAVGYEKPRVALLSATETVNPVMQSTIDASAITVMNTRGSLKRADIDGPMALDAALLDSSARTKGLSGPVAGQADILMLDDIESANSTSKALIGENGDAMGVIMGAGTPVAFPSRGDSELTRYNSLLLAVFLSHT